MRWDRWSKFRALAINLVITGCASFEPRLRFKEDLMIAQPFKVNAGGESTRRGEQEAAFL